MAKKRKADSVDAVEDAPRSESEKEEDYPEVMDDEFEELDMEEEISGESESDNEQANGNEEEEDSQSDSESGDGESENESESEDGDDIDEIKQITKAKKKKKEKDEDGIGSQFASALKHILSGGDLTENPIMSKSKALDRVRSAVEKERKRRKRASEKLKIRRMLQTKNHTIPDITKDAHQEQRLRKVATKGVVQLFNAINKQQTVSVS